MILVFCIQRVPCRVVLMNSRNHDLIDRVIQSCESVSLTQGDTVQCESVSLTQGGHGAVRVCESDPGGTRCCASL